MADNMATVQSTGASAATAPAAARAGTAHAGEQKEEQDDVSGEKRKRSAHDDGGATAANRSSSGKQSGGKFKRRDMGRSKYDTSSAWKRNRIDDQRQRNNKRDDYKPAIHVTEFSKEEIAAEEKRPKRKVAVMIGYAGTGYFGMQLNHTKRTIEGDLFKAFVAAGAVSKANADDPKKVSFVRCARTDKGVHAAGNIISLKLVIEDENVVEKINSNLVPQIRVWGIERTLNSFSAYNHVDSRVYEYLIPTHCFLPPHPKSFLGKRLADSAKEMGDTERWEQRQQDVATFWEEAEEKYIKPILDQIEPEMRKPAWDSLFENDEPFQDDVENEESEASSAQPRDKDIQAENDASAEGPTNVLPSNGNEKRPKDSNALSKLEETRRKLRAALVQAKRDWRITPGRLAQVKSALSMYEGVKNFHNFTIRVKAQDPSAKRVIKSFAVNETPILIDGTEWLSMKVHGQSFMMHQIRKMVGMVALVVRCGTPESRLYESMGHDRMSIPRAPGLGLLLERPIFDNYNKKLRSQQGGTERNSIGFENYQEEMDLFKQREIYDRIYQEEAAGNHFHQLFWAVDSLRSTQFLYLTSKGLAAVMKEPRGAGKADQTVEETLEESSDDEDIKNDGN